MKAISQKKQIFFFTFFIILLTIFTRLLFLDRVPVGMLQDEIKHIMTEKSLFLTGKSIYQDWRPLSLTSESHDVKDSELLPVIMSPFVGVLPYAMYFVRLPYAVLGVVDVLLIFFIARFLFGKMPALFVAFLASINPYFIFFSRLAFDTHVAMFFMLLGIVLLFSLKHWWKLIAFLSFGAAFYTYTGIKLIFLPLLIFLVWWFAGIYQKKEKIPFIVIGILSFFLVVFFAASLKNSETSTRAGELLTPFSQSIAKEVVLERSHALVSPITSFTENKLTIWLFHVVGSYVDAFSLRTLFVTGENSTHLAMWYIGYFYLIDLWMIAVGAVALFKEKRKSLWLLVGIIFLSPITGSVRIEALGSHTMHAVMMFPALILVSGYGLYKTIITLYKKSPLFLGIVLAVYAISFGNFIFTYFFRLPVYNSEGFVLSKRVVSRYLSFETQAQESIAVVVKDPKEMFQDYLLYNNLYTNRQQAETVNAILRNGENRGTYTYGPITFTNKPNEIDSKSFSTVIFESILPVKVSGKYVLVPSLSDGGEIFRIYNGKACSSYTLKQYPYALSFHDLAIEKLSKEEFCTTFITSVQ